MLLYKNLKVQRKKFSLMMKKIELLFWNFDSMMRTLAFIAILGVTLLTDLNGALAQTKVIPQKLPQPQSSPSLTESDVKKLIQEEIEKGGAIRDRVQADVNRTFGLTTGLLQFQIAVLAVLPIVVAVLGWSLRTAIQKQLVEESKKQVKEQLESLIQAEIQSKISSLEKDINDSREKIRSISNLFEQEVKQKLKELPIESPKINIGSYSYSQSPFSLLSPPSKIASELRPPSPSLPELKAEKQISVTASSLKELLQKIEVIEKTDPNFRLSYEDYFKLGNSFFVERDFEKALEFYQKALQLKPNDFDALLNKSALLAEIGRYKEAISSNSVALELNSNSAEAWNNQGYILEKTGELLKALAAYERSIELKPSSEAWDGKGIILNQLGRLKESIEAHNKAIEIDPSFADAWVNKGVSLNKLGQYDEAIINYEKAIELQPNFAKAWYNKGNSLDKLEKIEEAIVAYQKAIELQPSFAEAWCNKGLISRKNNDLVDALYSVEKALSYNPGLVEALSEKAYILALLERYEEALSAFDNAISSEPKDISNLYFCKGIVLAELDRHENAINAYCKAIECNFKIPEAQSRKGLSYLKLRQYNDAISSFDEAIKLDPNSAENFYNRACTFSLMNNLDKAIDDLSQSIKMNPDFRNKAKLETDFDLIRNEDRFVKLIESNAI
jgi:tetratricopeptide (TPR) repeat protein